MIRADIHATTLGEYYRLLVAAQESAHGPGYCSHHPVIASKVDTCASYAELGVNQGATLACALLAGFKGVEGVDKDLGPLRPAEGLFRAYARNHSQHLSLWEQDSREPIGEVDFLLIDSLHTADHLRDELAVHGGYVKKFILAHDTFKYSSLQRELDRYARQSGIWTIQETRASGAGWTLLARTG